MIFPADYELSSGPRVLEVTEELVKCVHGPQVGLLTCRLAVDHPTPSTVLTLVHRPTGAAASTLSLIPWRWRIDETVIDAWEVGIVATAEDHRGQGLSSALMTEGERRMNEAGIPLGIIQGIPHFYRKFGYEHAFNLENHLELAFHQVPALEPGWTFRAAGPEDADLLEGFARKNDRYEVASHREMATWKYRLTRAAGTETELTFEIIGDSEGRPRGYLAVTPRGFGEGLVVHEVAGDEVWPAAAARCVELARNHGKPYLRLNLGAGHPFAAWARDRGAHDKGGWNWQVAVPDPTRLLQALTPTLERRARASGRRWTVTLDGYRTTHHLAFDPEKGLTFPATLEAPMATVKIPPELWAKLALGWKPVRRLKEFYPDLFGWGDRALDLLELLFPERQGFIESRY